MLEYYSTRLSAGTERWMCYCGGVTLVGAWLGAFPILLDWNRPWQVSDKLYIPTIVLTHAES